MNIKSILFGILFLSILPLLQAQEIGVHYCIITMTNTKYNKGNKPLTRIISNPFPVPVTIESYGGKLNSDTKLIIQGQYLNYLLKNYPNAIKVFNGGFNQGTMWALVKPSEREITDLINGRNHTMGHENHNIIRVNNFKFKKVDKSTIDLHKIISGLKGYLKEGKSLSELKF